MNHENGTFHDEAVASQLEAGSDHGPTRKRLSGEAKTAYDREVYETLKANGPLNSLRLQKVLETKQPPNVLHGALKRLQAEGLLTVTGNRRGATYSAQ